MTISKNIKHCRFLITFFKEVNDAGIISGLPNCTDEIGQDGRNIKVDTCFGHKNTNLFIPLIKEDQKTIIYSKVYCSFCEK